jgi:hypothetical protein
MSTQPKPSNPLKAVRGTRDLLPPETALWNRIRVCVALVVLGFIAFAPADRTEAQKTSGIPRQLQGRWRIQRIIPTRTITCWVDQQARGILGTEIEYLPVLFRWRDYRISNPSTTVEVLTADEFSSRYSGGGRDDSQADFKQLGIDTPSIEILTVNHPAADITGGTTEIPGDTVLLKSRDRIVVTVCNVYFEAIRIPA